MKLGVPGTTRWPCCADFPFGEGARDAELRVLRGELTAAHDCESAIRDFVAVSDKVAPAPVLDRALYGRAACEARLGQRAQAAASFRAYLRQFPDGSFAAEARRQVGEKSREAQNKLQGASGLGARNQYGGAS